MFQSVKKLFNLTSEPAKSTSDEKTLKILFTGAGRMVEIVNTFLYAAGTLGIDIKLYGADVLINEPALLRCHYRRQIPAPDAPDYGEKVLEICRKDKIDLLIPLGKDEYPLMEYEEKLRLAGTTLLLGDKKVRQTCLRLECMDMFLRECDLYSHFGNEDKMYDGEYYEVDTFCGRDKKPVYITPRREEHVHGQKSKHYRIVQDDRLIREVQTILEKLQVFGPMTFCVRRNREDKKDYFVNMYPFLAGDLPVSVKAGADTPLAIILMMRGEQLKYQEKAAEDGLEFDLYQKSIQIKEKNHYLKEMRDFEDLLELSGDIKAVIFNPIGTILLPEGIHPKAAKVLQKLHDGGRKIGIILEGMEKYDIPEEILRCIDEVIRTDELAGNGNPLDFRKPNDISYLIMRRRLRINLRNMAFVGVDKETDFVVPEKLDMMCCLLEDGQ